MWRNCRTLQETSLPRSRGSNQGDPGAPAVVRALANGRWRVSVPRGRWVVLLARSRRAHRLPHRPTLDTHVRRTPRQTGQRRAAPARRAEGVHHPRAQVRRPLCRQYPISAIALSLLDHAAYRHALQHRDTPYNNPKVSRCSDRTVLGGMWVLMDDCARCRFRSSSRRRI